MGGSPYLMLLLIACATAGVGAFLYTLAARIAWDIRVHDLRVQTHRLRIEQNRKIAQLRGFEEPDAARDIPVEVISTPSDPGHPERPDQHRKAA